MNGREDGEVWTLSVGAGRGGASSELEKAIGTGIGRVYGGIERSDMAGGRERAGSEGAVGVAEGGGGGDADRMDADRMDADRMDAFSDRGLYGGIERSDNGGRTDREDSEGAIGGTEGGRATDLTDALSDISGVGGGGFRDTGVAELIDSLSDTSGVGGGGFLGGGIIGGGKSAAVGDGLVTGGKPACFSSSHLVTTGSASSYNASP